jgi:hypothetical protein
MAITAPETSFTRDILGRYVCNSFAEAQRSGPFDVVILGGGTFGLALAQNLFAHSKPFDGSPGTVPDDGMRPPNFRVLVLEAGPLTLAEHTQDVPNLQLYGPDPLPKAGCPLPTTRQALIQSQQDKETFLEAWGLPWNSQVAFGGLAYCLGGRSLYWGGWSPSYLHTEMPTAPQGAITAATLWPPVVAEDLFARFFDEAATQTGVATSNDFINGALHDHYRQALHAMYGAIPDAVPLVELPDYTVWAGPHLTQQLAAPPYPGFNESLRLDAPLAVETETRPGFFPLNKFSSPPLAITAVREAATESKGDDTRKRLMIVPNCHVRGLSTRSYTLATGAVVQEVVGIDTSNGPVDLSGTVGGNANRRPVVVLAMGAIESARLAQLSVGSTVPNGIEIGRNLMVHVRKNATFSGPIPAGLALAEQQLTALLVRCRPVINGTPVHFHCQITASAVPAGAAGNRSDSLLFQNVPDLDHVRIFAEMPPGRVDVAIRAVGEMLPNPGTNTVTVPLQPADPDEFQVPRASVSIVRGPEEAALGVAMDNVLQTLAQQLFGAPGAGNIRLDGLGTTFHESGTLRMGNDPAASVTNAEGQFHHVTNLYAGDASVLPTSGSANPVMNGVALRRRLAKRLVPEGDGVGAGSGRPIRPFFNAPLPAAFSPPGTVVPLFDGQTLAGWRMAGRGSFHVIDGALQSVPSFDLGLLWSTQPMPPDYRLEMEFFTRTPQTNSGVFLRFTHPDASGFYSPAWAPVSTGFEVQIDNTGAPNGWLKHRTGTVYNVNYPNDPNQNPGAPVPTAGDFANPVGANVGVWNALTIEVRGDVFTVNLNGTDTARYTNTEPNRGRFSAGESTFVGLQSYSNYSYTTAFRNIRMTVL